MATSTAQMLSTIVRTALHRRAVTDWLPQAERQPEVKSRRGWEKTSALSSNTSSPWVAKQLVHLLGDSERERDSKVSLPLPNLLIEYLSYLTLISWWMLYYLLLPLWRKKIQHLRIFSLSHLLKEIVSFYFFICR